MTQNPLTQYHRQPKIHVELPSEGKFYDEKFIDQGITTELPIKAMTAADEYNLKNPDALLTGDAIADVIESCVPSINGKTKKLLTPDVNVIMMGIRFASYGDEFEVNVKCPECGEDNAISLSIRALLGNIEKMQDEYTVELDDVTMYLKAHTFETSMKAALAEFEQQKIIQVVDQENMSESEKFKQVGNAFRKMVTLNFDQITDAIEKVQVPTEEGQVTVTQRAHIREYIEELDRSSVETIRAKIQSINETGLQKSHDVECIHCGHSWTQEGVEFNPTNFFDTK